MSFRLQSIFLPSHCNNFPFYSRALNDKLGEAKASGNLGNTLKVLGKFDEAIACCQRHLDISRELNDRVSVSQKRETISVGFHGYFKVLGKRPAVLME